MTSATVNDSLSAALISELETEAQATRQLLEAIPADKLQWKPHPKSMTLGQLALHVAGIPGSLSGFLEIERFDVTGTDFKAAEPKNAQEIQQRFETSLDEAKDRLRAFTSERASETWQLTKGDQVLWSLPKSALARALMFNHLYHHRGQLTVYLRLLDVPVPVTYGRSADLNPFG